MRMLIHHKLALRTIGDVLLGCNHPQILAHLSPMLQLASEVTQAPVMLHCSLSQDLSLGIPPLKSQTELAFASFNHIQARWFLCQIMQLPTSINGTLVVLCCTQTREAPLPMYRLASLRDLARPFPLFTSRVPQLERKSHETSQKRAPRHPILQIPSSKEPTMQMLSRAVLRSRWLKAKNLAVASYRLPKTISGLL